jgi:hypothetical protein
MKTTLKQPVSLYWISCFAEVCTLAHRPDLQVLCRVVSGDATLPDLSDTARQNMTRYCAYLGLVDSNGTLTKQGETCIKTAQVPVPEKGVYSFLLAEHQAFGLVLLHMKREKTNTRDTNTKDLVPLSTFLSRALGREFSDYFSPQKFILKSLPSLTESAQGRATHAEGRCELVWNLDLMTGANTRHLECFIPLQENGEKRFRVSLESLPEELVRQLMPRWDSRWNSEHRFVAVRDDKQGESFQRDLELSDVELPGQGTFQSVRVQSAPIGPCDDSAANEWAMRILLSRLPKVEGYLTHSMLSEQHRSLSEGTPLALFALRSPSVNEVQKQLEQTKPAGALYAWWRLTAPIDLGVQP